MDQSLLVYKEGVRNYLYSNPEGFNDNLKKMSALESEGDVLRREIENALYTQTALVRSRGDIMRLFEKTRSITDLLNDSLFQFEIETPFIPSELNPEFMKLTEFSTLAVESVVPAAKAYFKAPETVQDKINRAYFYEKEAVKYSQTIKRMKEDDSDELPLLEMFASEEEFSFAKELMQKAMEQADENKALISKALQNWEADRVAYMDQVILLVALAEIREFHSIALEISMNEYIEIAKEYSSEKSYVFINGVLNKVVNDLRAENQLFKFTRN
jgi:transcription antitermination factor NusB